MTLIDTRTYGTVGTDVFPQSGAINLAGNQLDTLGTPTHRLTRQRFLEKIVPVSTNQSSSLVWAGSADFTANQPASPTTGQTVFNTKAGNGSISTTTAFAIGPYKFNGSTWDALPAAAGDSGYDSVNQNQFVYTGLKWVKTDGLEIRFTLHSAAEKNAIGAAMPSGERYWYLLAEDDGTNLAGFYCIESIGASGIETGPYLSPGAPSSPTTGATPYVHNQAVAATTWTVSHNLGTTTPLVDVWIGGVRTTVPVQIVDSNTLTVGPLAVADVGSVIVLG